MCAQKSLKIVVNSNILIGIAILLNMEINA